MRHGEHPQFLAVLREQAIQFLQSQIDILRNGEFSGQPPATSSPRNYLNSLRLADDRFILINRPHDAPVNSALQFCLGRGRTIIHEPIQADWMPWSPRGEDWNTLARERASWVAQRLIDLSVAPN